MEEVLTELAIIWAPTLVSVLCMVVAVVKCVSKVKFTCDEFKQANLTKKLTDRIDEITAENLTLKKELDELLDKLTRINGYSERKYHHEHKDKEV